MESVEKIDRDRALIVRARASDKMARFMLAEFELEPELKLINGELP